MRVAIIGAGLTGLAAAHRLTKKGIKVVVFDSGKRVGGLAGGYKISNWKWSLEYHYHHLFTNDRVIRKLAKEVGQKLILTPCKSSIYYKGKIHDLGTPAGLLLFDRINIFERIRVGLVLAYLKITPFWKNMEKITSREFLIKFMGYKSWNIMWKPLFEKKFGNSAKSIPASWFWGRIKKRSLRILYPENGFQHFAEIISKKIRNNGGSLRCGEQIINISKKDKFIITTKDRSFAFDKVVNTLPNEIFSKIAKSFEADLKLRKNRIHSLGAVNLVLRINKQFLEDGTYWLNMNDLNSPFLVLVEHTNLISNKYYGGDTILYIGNYTDTNSELFSRSAKSLVNHYIPELKRLRPDFSKKWILGLDLFKASNAQPIIPLNYSAKIAPIKTAVEGLYTASIEQVYPWDRGTNYAVELGEKAAKEIIDEYEKKQDQ